MEWGVGGGRVWLWLLWKYSKTKYFKADEKKPTNSWLANGAPLSPHPCTKAAAAWATAACMVASGLSVSNTGLLLVVNGREIVFSSLSPALLFNCCYSVLPESCSISLFIIPCSVKSCPKLTPCALLCFSTLHVYKMPGQELAVALSDSSTQVRRLTLCQINSNSEFTGLFLRYLNFLKKSSPNY